MGAAVGLSAERGLGERAALRASPCRCGAGTASGRAAGTEPLLCQGDSLPGQAKGGAAAPSRPARRGGDWAGGLEGGSEEAALSASGVASQLRSSRPDSFTARDGYFSIKIRAQCGVGVAAWDQRCSRARRLRSFGKLSSGTGVRGVRFSLSLIKKKKRMSTLWLSRVVCDIACDGRGVRVPEAHAAHATPTSRLPEAANPACAAPHARPLAGHAGASWGTPAKSVNTLSGSCSRP